jgi:hypothetical protein
MLQTHFTTGQMAHHDVALMVVKIEWKIIRFLCQPKSLTQSLSFFIPGVSGIVTLKEKYIELLIC